MKLRTLLLTVVILAALSVAAYFATRQPAAVATDSRVGQPLVSRATVEQAAKFRLTDQGKTVTLTRQSDGTWHVATYHDLPAEFGKLATFIDALTEAKLDRLVTSSPERIARLDFKDTTIALLTADDKPLWRITLGKTPDTGSGRFLRFGTENKAFLTNASLWLDPEPKNWAATELLALKADTIAKVEIPFPDAPAPLTFTRAKPEEPWTSSATPAGEQVSAAKLASVISTAGSLRFSDTSDLTDPAVAAARAHARTIKLTTFDGKTFAVTFARKPEEKKIKPPVPDAKTVALGSSAAPAPHDAKPAASVGPEFETIPAGPVFVAIAAGDPAAPVNALMQKRAYQISDYFYTALPGKPADLFEPAPKPEPTKPAAPASKP
ncbi:MAG: DUF4340 domain-containing protein [Verrucomicrobia bacterium]|nr:DUF4340 domain-containing protein [Verrucomicrobiota bacterium]